MSKSERYRQIIEQTRIRFLQDADVKMIDLHNRFADFSAKSEPEEQDCTAMVDQVHRHVHALKGVALTLSYVEIDIICAAILEYILIEPKYVWKPDNIEFLQHKVEQLDELLKQASR